MNEGVTFNIMLKLSLGMLFKLLWEISWENKNIFLQYYLLISNNIYEKN